MKIFFFFMGLLALTLLAWQEGYRFNASSSMPSGIYRIETTSSIQRGDLVAVCLGGNYAILAKERGYLRDGICPSGVQPLLKFVAALEGDIVRIEKTGILITPKGKSMSCLWAARQEKDRQGRIITAQHIEGIVPQGESLLMTPHQGSFDGRYFGFVSLNTLSKVQPFFVF